jgi:hypothetical protein
VLLWPGSVIPARELNWRPKAGVTDPGYNEALRRSGHA